MNNDKAILRPALILGVIVLACGTGVMAPVSFLGGTTRGLPEWRNFTATTVGDTLLLPGLGGSLLAAFRYLPGTGTRTEKAVLVSGGLLGIVGGAALQVSWVIDARPRLTWVLTQPHHLSPAGWYHAIFLCAASGLMVSLAFGVAYRARHCDKDNISKLVVSPVLVVILVCIWTFVLLVVYDGGAGVSRAATLISVLISALSSAFLCLYSFRSWNSLRAISWAFVLTVLLSAIVTQWPAGQLAYLGLIVAVGLAVGISLRDTKWRDRLIESLLICLVGLCLVVLPLNNPRLVGRNLLLGAFLVPAVLIITRIGPLVRRESRNQCLLFYALIVTIFALSIPISGWLFQAGSISASAGAATILIAATLFGQLLVPGYKADMTLLMEQEAAHSGVTSDPQLSSQAARVAVRGGAWGLAAIGGLLGIVVSAGPSMGYVDGKGLPAVKSWLIVGALAVAFLTACICFTFRRSSWAPLASIAGGIIVSLLTVVYFINQWKYHTWWWVWVIVAAIIVAVWQIESITANAAMRPRWLIRRPWRHAVAMSTALAIASNVLVACTLGVVNNVGRPALSLPSLGVFAASEFLGFLLVAGAAWALDWQPSTTFEGQSANQTSTAPNWARYRMRSSLFQDFFLMQGLAVIGSWLPALSLAHIGFTSEEGIFNSIVTAGTGILFFGPILVWSMQNSVKHVEEQSSKASRRSASYFCGTFPYVIPAEEFETIGSMFRSKDGPSIQRQWAQSVAVHQLHLNILATAFTLISLVGSLGILSGISLAGSQADVANTRIAR